MRHSPAMTAALMLVCASRGVGAQKELPTWTLSAAPVVSIGGDGNPVTEFSRIAAAFRLSNGVTAVVNGATSEIRMFDAKGRFVRTFGRKGAGPGEFRSSGWVGRSGDTALMFDGSLKRITSLALGSDPVGIKTTSLTAPSTRGPVYATGRLSDGRWLAVTYASPGWDGPPGVYRLPASAGVINADAGGDIRWLGQFKGMAIFVNNPTGDIKQALVGSTAFAPFFQAVASGPQIWLGDSEGDSLFVLSSPDGKRTAVHLPFPRRGPTRAGIDAAREQELTRARNARDSSFVTAKYSAKYLPRLLPSFEALLPGPNDEVWVQEHTGSRAEPARYLVIDRSGASRAWVNFPSGVRVRDVGLDYVVGVHEDDDGVETVRVYRLSRR